MKLSNLYIIMLLFGCIFSSCEMLEPDTDNQQEIDFVQKNAEYAEGILLSAYKKIPSNYTFNEVATDDAVTNQNGNQYRRMATGEWSALYSPVTAWNTYYSAIANLNYFFSIANDVEWSWQSSIRNQLFIAKNTGEAHVLRAFFYMELLKNHAGISNGQVLGIPLVTEHLEREDQWKKTRAAFTDVVDQIYSDLDKAIELLPYTWDIFANSDPKISDSDSVRVFSTLNEGRVNGKIAKALKSRIALLAASPTFNEGNYNGQKAAIAAEFTAPLLIEIGGPDNLPPDGVEFYNEDTDIDNADILWRNSYSTNNTSEQSNFPPSFFGQGRVNPTQNFVDAFPMASGFPIRHSQSGYDENDPYVNRDPRFAKFIIYHGSTFKATTIDVGVNSPTLDGLNKTEYSSRTGYYLKKLLRTNVNLDPSVMSTARHFYAFIRYTELFLNYAEAANEAWGPDADPNGYGFTARDIVSAIRKRAGITQPDNYIASILTKERMRDIIRNERRLELCFEGFRFWDIRRWQSENAIIGTVSGMSIDNGTYTPIQVENRNYRLPAAYYGPIPQNEINKNELLIQNQGW